MRPSKYPNPTSKTSRQAQRSSNEFEMSFVGQRGSVWLTHPRDMDLFQAIGAGRLTIKRARAIVAERHRAGQRGHAMHHDDPDLFEIAEQQLRGDQ